MAARVARVLPWAALTATMFLAMFSARMTVLSLRAADNKPGPSLMGQSQADADGKSAGCISCHTQTDEPTMHATGTVRLGCTDCHGGNADVRIAAGVAANSPEYDQVKQQAHPQPRDPELRNRSANPERAYTEWLKESPEYVRFVNPGDLRVALETCGSAGCHASEIRNVSTSMMTTGGILWGAALYNNGAYPLKDTRFGESYARDGSPQAVRTIPPPTPEETRAKGVLPEITPLERWEISQPGNVLRVFERGGGPKGEVGEPVRADNAGKPDDKLSTRGFGTELRTDPVFLGLQKTRLLDPLLSLPGTNDQPGDYRASGCTACHVVYANDRSSEHSAQYAPFGNRGFSGSKDPTIPHEESGHPIRHEFTRSIPSSQCMVCHVHPGTNMLTTYFGYTWWDNESDGDAIYPKQQRNPTAEERFEVSQRNPEGAAVRGLWSDPKFLEETGSAEFNQKLKSTQFADFHSHGWLFRAVFARDRQGHLLDEKGGRVSPNDPKKFDKAAHLEDIHLQKGMQCVDCHFEQDNHGGGKLYAEPRAAIELDCTDCHGTISRPATLLTSGPAAPAGGTHLEALRTPWGERRFEWHGDKLYQRSMMDPHLEWEVVQTLDSITPGNPHYNEKSRLAKTLRTDGVTWGDVPKDESQLAHANSSMTCYACHTSWTPNCFGCHLEMKADEKRPMLHNEGLTTRNWTSYNFQVLRDDGYMLAVDGTVTGHRIAPARSSCAILVSSQNANREWLYNTQQTVSAEGFSGQAFSTFVPHTVRARETKTCTDCHVSSARDNNAWMSMLLLQGTNFVNFMGRYVYVAAGSKGFDAVVTAEHDEPEAVIGSDLQRMAYPDDFHKHVDRKHELTTAYHHDGNVLDVQLRGEYAYAAMGPEGFRIFDVANIDNKGFSERMVTAPVSPLGQRLYVKTKYATAVATPTTLAVDPLRTQNPANEEQKIHLMYGFLYVTDKYEGLIVVGNPDLKGTNPGVGTLLDGNPQNNFIGRAATFNPGGILNGARRITIAGTYAYILCDRGLVVVDLDNPLAPRVTAEIGAPDLMDPQGVAVQFRYAFVADGQGLKTLDVTDLAHPRIVAGALVPIDGARNVTVSRTYAYVSTGKNGLVLVNVEQPEHPRIDQTFNAGGQLNDVNDVKIGAVDASVFAYVADGRNGLRILQVISPEDSPESYGFSPRPTPKLIATYRTAGPALAISRGIDRDRAVDESGNQIAVFGRRGARPLNRVEAEKLYLRAGKLYTVTDAPPGPPRPLVPASSSLRALSGSASVW
jgi:LVIVD repeat